jgi:hypothetical protein
VPANLLLDFAWARVREGRTVPEMDLAGDTDLAAAGIGLRGCVWSLF